MRGVVRGVAQGRALWNRTDIERGSPQCTNRLNANPAHGVSEPARRGDGQPQR